jgi:hypothetical protein
MVSGERRLLARLSGKSVLAAIRYALDQWTAWCASSDYGRIELDTNTVERAMRPSPSAIRTRSSPAMALMPWNWARTTAA